LRRFLFIKAMLRAAQIEQNGKNRLAIFTVLHVRRIDVTAYLLRL